MLSYSGQELRDRMQQVGFADVKLFGNLDGDVYGPNASRLIAVGRKPAKAKAENHRTKPSRRRAKARA